MIDRDHQLRGKRQAQLLGMRRGAVYYLPRPVSDADLALMRRIDELHLEYPFMGAHMLRDQLDREGTARPHSSLDRITPEQAYLDLLPIQAEAA